MPIIIPESTSDNEFYDRLSSAGAAVISEELASHQDVRPARIGLLNLMPAAVMEDTELRWLRLISHTVLQIEPVLVKFDDDEREDAGCSRKPVLKRYTPFSQVTESGLDGLIITGDNIEVNDSQNGLLPFEKVTYSEKLGEIIDWSSNEVPTTIFSCLASHFALHRRHGIDRNYSKVKNFGVYRHTVVDEHDPIAFNLDDAIISPHSRWGDIPLEQILDAKINVVATNDKVGWLLATEGNRTGYSDLYIQGHPEYWRQDLHNEYARDQRQLPENYYPENDPTKTPILSWSTDARAILANWINHIYSQYSNMTNLFDISTLGK